jgi:hypothetical protein
VLSAVKRERELAGRVSAPSSPAAAIEYRILNAHVYLYAACDKGRQRKKELKATYIWQMSTKWGR